MWIQLGNKSYCPSAGLTPSEYCDYLVWTGIKLPPKTSQERWNAMLKWLKTRKKLKDWVEEEDKIDKKDLEKIKELED